MQLTVCSRPLASCSWSRLVMDIYQVQEVQHLLYYKIIASLVRLSRF
jgi:hypothetical protein